MSVRGFLQLLDSCVFANVRILLSLLFILQAFDLLVMQHHNLLGGLQRRHHHDNTYMHISNAIPNPTDNLAFWPTTTPFNDDQRSFGHRYSSSVELFVPFATAGWIDPDTPLDKRTIASYSDIIKNKPDKAGNLQHSHKQYDLVMSDEFNVDKRSFKDGSDPMWTALDKSDDDQTSSGKRSLQFYNSSMITTKNGHLVISTNTEDTKWKGFNPFTKKYTTMSRNFKSGMLQSWNKFCFTGGILEIDLQFPGKAEVGGLWPAVWLLGNLGRATYEASTNLMWPWSYEKCDRDMQYAQDVSGCSVTSHYSLHPQQGRGATEIDIVEVMSGPSTPLPYVKKHLKRPYNSMTLQIAPGIPSSKKRPFSGTLPEWGFHWYNNLTYGTNVSINPFFYGTYLAPTKTEEPIKRSKRESYQADAISALSPIDKSFYERMHTFRLEWQPGDEGYLHWYMDGEYQFGLEAASLKEQGSMIPNEPSSVVINTAISTSWGFPNAPWGCQKFDCKAVDGQCGFNPGFCHMLPASFLVDHIRIYQDKNNSKQTVGCNPEKYPTKKYILGHEYRYMTDDKEHALEPVKVGGGKCKRDSDCRGNNNEVVNDGDGGGDSSERTYGSCSRGVCSCTKAWTGPHCLVPAHKDDGIDWEDDSADLFILYPHIPSFVMIVVALLLATIFANYGMSYLSNNQRGGGNYGNSNGNNNSNINSSNSSNSDGVSSYISSISNSGKGYSATYGSNGTFKANTINSSNNSNKNSSVSGGGGGLNSNNGR